MVLVIYKKRNKGVVGVQDKDGKTWHTKGAFEDRDAMKTKTKERLVARRRRSGRRGKARFGKGTKHNLMLMRTRNLGVVGTRGAGVIAHTMGPYYPRVDEVDIFALLTEDGQPIKHQQLAQYLLPETA